MAEDTTTASRGVAMGLGQLKLFSVAFLLTWFNFNHSMDK